MPDEIVSATVAVADDDPNEFLFKPKKIDVRKFLIKVQGNKKYLPVYARLMAFRSELAPLGWSITTTCIWDHAQRDMAPDGATWGKQASAKYRCEIRDEKGRVRATGEKKEDAQGFPDYAEKAETGSIGRALSILGYGTEYTDDLDELSRSTPDNSRFVDSPKAMIGPQNRADTPRYNNNAAQGPNNGNRPVQQPQSQPAPLQQGITDDTMPTTSDRPPALPETTKSKVSPASLVPPQIEMIDCPKCNHPVAKAQFSNGTVNYNADGNAHPPTCGQKDTGWEKK